METTGPLPRRVLIFLPSWVGDVVMATPTLRAVRSLFPQARITYLLKDYVRPVVDAMPWYDRLIVRRKRKRGKRPTRYEPNGPPRRRPNLAARLRRREFDMAILMPNSFRSALLASSVGIPRRLGYERDGRGFLLTDRLLPMRRGGRYIPVPVVDYYLGLVRYLGAESPSRRVELFSKTRDDARAEAMLAAAGVGGDARPIVMLNPGAATKGEAKLWPADRFAAVADALIDRHGAAVLVNGSPKERPLLDAVHTAARHDLIDLPNAGGDLTLLKSIARTCALVVTNDTGARHIAAAMGTPVVSLFGPTNPRWTTLDFDRERVVAAPDGDMQSIPIGAVLDAAEQLLRPAAATEMNAG